METLDCGAVHSSPKDSSVIVTRFRGSGATSGHRRTQDDADEQRELSSAGAVVAVIWTGIGCTMHDGRRGWPGRFFVFGN